MDKKTKIMNRIMSDYNMLVEKGHEVVGVFLQGSQNYNLDYEGSDIDTKAIILPSFEDFVLNKKLISQTLELPVTKEHVDIKDIRLMFENFKKQNINFIEILFTEYYIMNPKYESIFSAMYDIREEIGRYDMYKALNSLAGMSMEKFKAMEHPYPTLIHKIEKFGYDGKQTHHVLRLNDFIKKFVAGKSYLECMVADDREFLIKVKKNESFTLGDARWITKSTCDETYAIAKEWMANNPNTDEAIVKHVDEVMTEVLLNIFKKRFNN